MKESINIEMSTSVRRDSARNLNLMIKSQDIHNSMFLLNFRDGKGDPIELGDDFTVEVLSVFKESKSEALTEATIYGNYAHWEFDTRFIHGKDTVFNYVYVKKDGVPVVSADANAFYFAVDLSKIDEGAERVAEYYDKNYEKVLHEFEVAINLTKDEWIEMSQDAKAFVDEIKNKTVDEFVELKMGEELQNLEVNYAVKLTELQSNDASITAQLAQKASKSEVRENTNDRPINVSEMDTETKQLFTGGAVAVVGENAVGSENLKGKAVIPEKTSFFDIIISTNRLDKTTNVIGEFVNQVTGDYNASPSHQRSQRIVIDKTKTNIIISTAHHQANIRYAIRNANGYWQSGDVLLDAHYLSANNRRYFVIPIVEAMHDFAISYAGNITDPQVMVEFTNESIPSSYTHYQSTETLKPTHLPPLEGENFADRSIGNEKLKNDLPDFVKTKNLASHKYLKRGKYIHQGSGALFSNPDHNLFHRIPIDGGGHLTVSGGFQANCRVVFEDTYNDFISGMFQAPLTVEVPSNARFVSYSSSGYNVDLFQIEIGTQATSFIEPGYVATNLLSNQVTGESEVIVNLPKKIFALEGEELNVYFDNIVSGVDKDYLFDIGATVGQQYEQFYRLTPIASGDIALSLQVYQNSKPIKTVSTTVKVSKKSVGNGVSKSIIILGDSTTNNGIVASKLNENFATDVMNIELTGTRGTGINKHEGRSGWTAQQYVGVASSDNGTVLNPFYNPTTQTFDLAYYKSQTGFSNTDYFIINLGINDTFGQTSDSGLNTKMTEIIGDFTRMINSIKSVSSNIKIGIAVTIPPNYSQDAFAKAYGVGQTRWRYKRNNILWCKKLIETYQDREAESIYLIPIHLNIDTRNNYGFQEEPISKRNPSVISRPMGNGGVHPVDSGYWQIADSYWFWLKSFES